MRLEYQRIADAIAQLAKDSGKPPLILSLCEWGEVGASVVFQCLNSSNLPCAYRSNRGFGLAVMDRAGG